jgi:ketosteroid isomerase-like protein
MGDTRRSRRPANAGEPLATEDAFFKALLEGDADSLEGLLTDDFAMVDVMRGAEIGRASFLEAIVRQDVRFAGLDVVERGVRRYHDVAVVIGRTAMHGEVGGEAFSLASRYTHVFARAASGGWMLASAQGTRIEPQKRSRSSARNRFASAFGRVPA